jgi:lysozyme
MDIYEQLRRDEGSRNMPYVDTRGKVTIGVGRNLTDMGVSQSEIDLMLQNDVATATETLHSRLPYFAALDPVRQAVLINMTFNMGFGGLEEFQVMLGAVAHGYWDAAASAMLDSAWAREVGDRATRLAQQLVTGEWV